MLNTLKTTVNGPAWSNVKAIDQTEGINSEITGHLRSNRKASLRSLISFSSGKKMGRVLGAAALALGLSTSTSFAQNNFAAAVQDPFGLSVFRSDAFLPTFIDIDGDGDLDFFATNTEDNNLEDRIIFKENIGDAQHPEFGQRIVDPFGITADTDIRSIEFTDLDLDGDLDGLGKNGDGDFIYFENLGNSQFPEFGAPELNPFGLEGGSSYSIKLQFVDLDADGDMDLISPIQWSNGLTFPFGHINQSNEEEGIIFESMIMQFHGFGSIGYHNYDFSDINGDGDIDLILAENDGSMIYSENSAHEFEPLIFINVTEDTFGYSLCDIDYEFMVPVVVDIDGDGDKDIFAVGAADSPSSLYFYENGLLSSTAQTTILNDELRTYPNPVQGDIINLESDYPIERVVLLTALGQGVDLKLDGNSLQLPENLTAGHYVLNIWLADGQMASKHIIKN